MNSAQKLKNKQLKPDKNVNLRGATELKFKEIDSILIQYLFRNSELLFELSGEKKLASDQNIAKNDKNKPKFEEPGLNYSTINQHFSSVQQVNFQNPEKKKT